MFLFLISSSDSFFHDIVTFLTSDTASPSSTNSFASPPYCLRNINCKSRKRIMKAMQVGQFVVLRTMIITIIRTKPRLRLNQSIIRNWQRSVRKLSKLNWCRMRSKIEYILFVWDSVSNSRNKTSTWLSFKIENVPWDNIKYKTNKTIEVIWFTAMVGTFQVPHSELS